MEVKLKYYPYNLELKHQFTISGNSRKHTPIIITELHYQDFTGYGEASLPPYLKETQESVSNYLSKIDISFLTEINDVIAVENYLSSLMEENYAAKTSLSIALYDLLGKLQNKPAREILGIPFRNEISTSYTIGIDSPDIIKQKVREAQEYSYLKIKLGTKKDREIIESVCAITDKPLFVDANQGWISKETALRMIEYLYKYNVILIEQPLPVELFDDYLWLKERSPLPLIADESIKTFSDLIQYGELFHGINIKLMKCGGMHSALKIINYCKQKNLKIMVGCMTETSCAITAGAELAVFADFVDLDGNMLINNDPFSGVETKMGKLLKNDLPGFGLMQRQT